MDAAVARRMWRVFEPYHAVVYFAQEVAEAMTAVGLKGWWMGYFAGRAAPMGTVTAPVVTATFHGFRPSMVERAIPDAWSFASPDKVLDARSPAVDAALRRLLGDGFDDLDAIGEATQLAGRAVEAAERTGRPLGAATAAVPRVSPADAPFLALWQEASALRELRGDGHVAALVQANVDGCESHVTLVATGVISRQALQSSRKWTDEEWNAAEDRLRSRGWLDADGSFTDAGRTARREIEARTDEAALGPWKAIGDPATDRLYELLRPLAARIAEAGGLPFPNPIGVPSED
ncbi:MAG: hypothetical protein L0221_18650 [Chloroflexi bacterium]|nr:hypothetical protein [Chloroflexota bacterium]